MADQRAGAEACHGEPGVRHQWRDRLWKNDTGVCLCLYNITLLDVRVHVYMYYTSQRSVS